MPTLRLLALALLASQSLHAAAPVCEWVTTVGGAKNDKTRAVTVDAAGNVFLAGETTDDGTFGSLQRKGLGGMDFFLSKLDPKGRVLWVQSLGGSQIDRGYGVVTDTAGNAYVTGHYQSTDAMALGKLLPNAGDYDIFVAKYSPAGELLWINTAGGKGYDYGHAIALDKDGDIVVSGAFVGEAHFGDTLVNAGDTKSRPLFCAKYTKDGKLLWVKHTTGTAWGSGHGIAVDAAANIYIGGSISGTGAFGSQPIAVKQGSAGIIIKLNSAGDAQWLVTQPGTPSAGIHEIAADATGRVWVAGMFTGKMTLGDTTPETSDPKGKDGFCAHYSPDGKLVWSHTVQGPETDYCLGVATDGKGHGFVTGEFTTTATLAGTQLVSQGGTDIYTAMFDEKGTLQWHLISGGAKGDNAYTMAWHPDGYLVIGGAWAAPATFGTVKTETSGGADAYGAKLWVK